MDGKEYFNKQWLRIAGIILLSFSIYDVIVNPFIPFNKLNPSITPIVHDWTKYGTFLVIFRILQGKSVSDQKWILSVLFALLGFTGYHLITTKIIKVDY